MVTRYMIFLEVVYACEMSILMVDNCSIHHVQEVKCNAWGFLTGYRNMDT